MLMTVVCDDEAPALELMTTLLTATGQVEIVGAFCEIPDAIAAVNAGGVDLVVLDIEMPGMSGVEAYGAIDIEPRPLLIFATAHPEYAVEAFGVEAIDYILKPLDPQRIARAIEKAARLKRMIVEREARLAEGIGVDGESDGVLKIRDAGRAFFIPHDDIVWIEAAGDYSIIHMDVNEATVRVTIKSIEALLPQSLFRRVHRSAIIAVGRIREIRMLPKGEAQIVMSNDATIRSSRSYRDVAHALAGVT